MAKNKKNNEFEVDDSLDLASIIDKLDGVGILEGQEILNTRPKIRSKVEVLNCLLGGGRPYGSITGSFGPPSGGKSTEAYESAAEFLKQEPDGIIIILDQESSADPSRLEYLGVSPKKVLYVKSLSIDSGFTRLIDIFKIIEKKQEAAKKRIPLYVVWDTISKGKAEDEETASRMDARNRARIIKSRMNDLSPWLDKLDVIMVLLNQVIIEADKYGNITMNAGGGVGLKHDEHLRLYITKGKTIYDDQTGMAIIDKSYLSLDKTKLSPKVGNIPLTFDITHGGKIDEHQSFIEYFQERRKLESSGGWWNISSIISESKDAFYGKYLETNFLGNKRFDDWLNLLKNDEVFYIVLRLYFMDLIGKTYELQKTVMKTYYDSLKSRLLEIGPGIFSDT
jgi:RecA/RadA recombinase